MTAAAFRRRLMKEREELSSKPPLGISLDESATGDSLTRWVVRVDGAEGTLYAGENFKLQFIFSQKYPFDSPQVTFIGDCIPVHPHIYSNGHICLSILDEDWSPALSVSAVCISIISMLSSCTKKERPSDNTLYVNFGSKNPKKTKWLFHGEHHIR